jgi:hypothetical protein
MNVEMRDLRKLFGVTAALDGLSLSIGGGCGRCTTGWG